MLAKHRTQIKRRRIMNTLKKSVSLFLAAVFCMGLCACATTPMTRSEIQTNRAEIKNISAQTMAKIYKNYPEAGEEVRKAVGYAVFSNFGFKFMFMGSARGKGVVFDSATKRETFMNMFELTPGFGFGAQKFACVFLFETRTALDDFIDSGWEFGGNTAAALQTSTQGSGGRLGVSVSPGVRMYQISESGAIVGVSLTGAKYYLDRELN
jgi:lipid-binding SYLF domain-containing protein